MSPVLPGISDAGSSLRGAGWENRLSIGRPSPLRVGSLLALEEFTGAELFPQHLLLPRGQLIAELLALRGRGERRIVEVEGKGARGGRTETGHRKGPGALVRETETEGC